MPTLFKSTGTLKVTTPSDDEIVMTRVFDAPRELVFEAMTTPALLKRWLGVHGGWVFAVCEIDLKVGGAYRYLWRGPDGHEMGMRGVYREVVRPERVVSTEKFDEAWYPGEALDTMALAAHGRKTTLTLTVKYGSKEVRDRVLETPMKGGVEAGYDKLAELLPLLATLPTLATEGARS
jgi:uncharacterized protein YndB with AHSA1/START domain